MIGEGKQPQQKILFKKQKEMDANHCTPWFLLSLQLPQTAQSHWHGGCLT
jgi:hypothetical protein